MPPPPFLASTCRFILKTCMSFWGELNIEGKENIPSDRPLIVLSNHISTVDPSVLGVSLPSMPSFIMKKELFAFPPLGFLFYTVGGFPIDRDKPGVDALRWARKRIRQNVIMCMFPEGTRSKSCVLQKGKSGALILAASTNATILPMGISGTEKYQSIFRVFKPSGKFKLCIGEPFKLADDISRSKSFYNEAIEEVMFRIAALLPEERRGDFGDVGSKRFIHTAPLLKKTV